MKNPIHHEAKGTGRAILINAYVLPNKRTISTTLAWDRAKGNLSWNTSQGYYIYRNDRIIRFGGWQGIITMDEHIRNMLESVLISLISMMTYFKLLYIKHVLPFLKV